MFHKRIDYINIKKSPSSFSMEAGVTDSTNSKMKKVESQQSFASEEAFVFHSTSIMMHFTQANMLDEFGNLNVNNEYRVSIQLKNSKNLPCIYDSGRNKQIINI